MSKEQKKPLLKVLAMVCIMLAVLSMGAAAVYAVLVSVTPSVTNAFQSDKGIGISLSEPQWEEYGKSKAAAYVPGQVIDKDPTVTLNEESVNAYVALKVQYYDGQNNEITFREFQEKYLETDAEEQKGLEFSDDWECIGALSDGEEYGSSVIYMYKEPLTQDDSSTEELENVTSPLFTKVYISSDLTQDEETNKLPQFNIKITAYAIQSDGIEYTDAVGEMFEYIKTASTK